MTRSFLRPLLTFLLIALGPLVPVLALGLALEAI